MKMLFRQRYKPKRSSPLFIKLLIGTFVVAILLFFASFFERPVNRVFSGSFETIQSFRSKVSSEAGIFISGITTDERELLAENQKLEEELEKFKTLDERMQAVEAERDSLREFLELRSKKEVVVSKVIAKPPAIPSGMIVIEAPEGGARKGAKVFDPLGQVLGTVSTLSGADYRKVVLYTAPGRKTEVFDSNGEIIEAVGRGGAGLYFEVPKGFEIKRGDLIYLSDGSLLAEVASVLSQKNDPFSKVYLRLLANLNLLNYVAVEK